MTSYKEAITNGRVETVGIASPKGANLIIFVTRKLINSLKSEDKRVINQIQNGFRIADMILVVYAGDISKEEKKELEARFLKGKIYLEMSLEENIEHFEEIFLKAEKNQILMHK